MLKVISDDNIDGTDFILYGIVVKKNGMLQVTGELIVYLKSKNCQPGHTYDQSLSISINEEAIPVDGFDKKEYKLEKA